MQNRNDSAETITDLWMITLTSACIRMYTYLAAIDSEDSTTYLQAIRSELDDIDRYHSQIRQRCERQLEALAVMSVDSDDSEEDDEQQQEPPVEHANQDQDADEDAQNDAAEDQLQNGAARDEDGDRV